MNLIFKLFNRIILDSLQSNIYIDNKDFNFFIKSLKDDELIYLIENSTSDNTIHYIDIIGILSDEFLKRKLDYKINIISFPICFN